MKDEFQKLLTVTKTLVTYIDEEYVFDKVSDAGCGGFDPHRSEKFMDLIEETKNTLNEIENAI
jgi:hypothetical protein